MKLVLKLSSEIEGKLMEQAGAAGMDAESFVLEALRERLAADEAAPLPRDVWKREFQEFLATSPDGNPNADITRQI